MNNTRTLMLAAVTALSLGAGIAMAQNLTPGNVEGAYFAGHNQTAPAVGSLPASQIQSGSSDVIPSRPGTENVVPFNGDYGDLANPG